MKKFLNYFPGFRSDKKWKKILGSIYYFFALLTLLAGIEPFLFFLAIPFFIFSIVDILKSKKNKKSIRNAAIIFLISLSIISANLSNIDAADNNMVEKDQSTKIEEVEKVKDKVDKSTVGTKVDEVKESEEEVEESDKEEETKEEENKKESFKEVGNLKVHYIDVGQGDSIFIQLPNGETALIDGGTRKAGSSVVSYLNSQNVERIDYIIATHPHEDHIGGLIEVINKYTIGKVYMPDKANTTRVFEDLLLAIQNKGNKITKAVAGNNILDKEGLSLKILSPESNASGSNLNNYSVVVKLNYKNTSFLFTGDAEGKSENTILNKGYNIRVDVLKLGHHGSDTSTTSEFLNKVNPKYAVISVGKGNQYNHPQESIINRLNNKGIKIYRTDLDGTIIATSDGEEISFNKEPSKIKETPSVGITKPDPKPDPEPPITDNVAEVYITNTGSKYHLETCRTLKKSKIPISLNSAKSQGYTPCKICNPPS